MGIFTLIRETLHMKALIQSDFNLGVYDATFCLIWFLPLQKKFRGICRSTSAKPVNRRSLNQKTLVVEVGADQTGGGGVEDPHVLR